MQTLSLSNEAFAALGGPDLVYVRPMNAAEVLSVVPADAIERSQLTPGQTLYALHSANGARLAVMADRDSAYAAALAHELAPVSVH